MTPLTGSPESLARPARFRLADSAGLATVGEVRAAALDAVACGADVVVSCGDLDYLDTSVLQVLLALRDALASRGQALTVEGASDKALALCRTAGLTEALGLPGQ